MAVEITAEGMCHNLEGLQNAVYCRPARNGIEKAIFYHVSKN